MPNFMLFAMAAPFIARTSGSTADITTFTGWATSLVSWFITTFQTVLNFMLSNPICFVGLVMTLIVAAVGMLRHIIGG